MNRGSYAVVFFVDDGTFSEIPASWILENKTSCLWPDTKNVSTLMTRQVAPDLNNPAWRTFDIEVKGYYDTIDAARKRASNVDYTSSEDERGRGLRRKKKSQRVIGSDSEGESSSSKENTPPPSLLDLSENEDIAQPAKLQSSYIPSISQNTTPRSSNIHRSKPTGNITGKNNSTTYRIIDNSMAEVVDDTNDKTIIHENDMEREISDLKGKVDYLIKINKKILMYVKEIEAKLEKTEMTEQKISGEFQRIKDKFPLQSTEELLQIDEILKKDEDLKRSFIEYIKSIGGRNAKEMISRIMAKLITNGLGISCSLLGKRNHLPFKDLIMMNMIISATRSVFTDSESAMELAIGEWLRLSKLRQSREKPLTPSSHNE